MNKILGYSLLLVGVLLIGFTIYQSYAIFTARTLPPYVFRVPPAQKNQNSTVLANNQQGVQAQINESIKRQVFAMFPAEDMYKMLNLAAWSILAVILIFAGGQIASLGIKLVT